MLQSERQPCLKPRKQWMRPNGSCSVIFKLRHRLAEDGCSVSQVSIARNLLSGSVDDPGAAEVAVSYLIRAAEQNDTEGVSLLEQCYKNAHGITDRNVNEVERCLRKSDAEKTAHRVGKEILDLVTPDGSLSLNASVFRHRLRDEHGKLTPDTDGQPRVGLDDITDAVKSCIEGRSPAVLITQNEHITNRLRYLENLTFLCATQVSSFYLWTNIVLTFVLSLLICTVLYSPTIVKLAQHEPFISFHAALILAVAFTAHLWHQKASCESFHAWAALINRFDATAVTAETQQKFQRYFYVKLLFHGCAAITCVCISLSQLKYVEFVVLSRSDIAVFTAMLFGSTLYNTVAKSKARAAIVASIIALAAGDYCYNLMSLPPDIFWASYLHWPTIAFKCFIYIFVFLKDGCAADVQYFVCVTWFHFCLSAVQNCAVQEILAAMLCVPTWVLLCVCIRPMQSAFVVLVLRQLLIADWLKVGLSSFLLYCLYKCVVAGTQRLRSSCKWKLKTVVPVLALAVLSVAVPSCYYATEESTLDLDKYKALCQGQVWGDANAAVTQQACAAYAGAKVHFSGHVTSIEMSAIQNVPKQAVSTLPQSLQTAFGRVLGNKWQSCHPKFQTEVEFARCLMYRDLGLPVYHLELWNVYSFEVDVELESGLQVKLITDSACHDFVTRLKDGSAVEVKGRLTTVVGAPRIWLVHASSEESVCDRNLELSWDFKSYLAAFQELIRFVF